MARAVFADAFPLASAGTFAACALRALATAACFGVIAFFGDALAGAFAFAGFAPGAFACF